MNQKAIACGGPGEVQCWNRALMPAEIKQLADSRDVMLKLPEKSATFRDPSLYFDRQHPIADGLAIYTPSGLCRVNRVRTFDRLMQLECYAYNRWVKSFSQLWYRLAAACNKAVKRHAEYKGAK